MVAFLNALSMNTITKPPRPSQNELLQGGPRLQLAAMFSTSVNTFAPPLIRSMVQQVFHYIVKPLITDPPKSGQRSLTPD